MINLKYILVFSILLIPLISISQNNNKMIKTEKEWKASLDEMSFQVLRNSYTERPFTGEYNLHFEKGASTVKVVTKNYLKAIINMKVIVGGQALIKPLREG